MKTDGSFCDALGSSVDKRSNCIFEAARAPEVENRPRCCQGPLFLSLLDDMLSLLATIVQREAAELLTRAN